MKIRITSDAVNYVEYHKNTKTLFVWFGHGACYGYINVPPSVFLGLLTSDSAGKYVNRTVKRYQCFSTSQKPAELRAKSTA